MTLLRDLPIIPDPSKKWLNARQRVDYREHREDLLEWLCVFGKDPEHAEGYSHATVKNTAYRTDQFYRWVWEREGYTTDLIRNHADRYLRELAGQDTSTSHKAKCVKALKRLFKWRVHEKGGEPWKPQLTFSDAGNATQPRDFLTKAERSRIREAALKYGSIPSYNSLTTDVHHLVM
ncbi:site-specific recombinase xerd [Halomarina pelagica]|uniref:site-specific recombinase xerd n=1 Tax=Halomarina pelagica TaxID=2961599 RepID=UPI0020C59C1A|nr:site-specific recombinase xerd [Halomarina sp. BND7]